MSYTNGLDKPTDYFNTKLYTGDGNNSRAVTGTGFQADWVWLKDRGSKGDTNYHHQTFDSVRGASAGALYTSLNNAEDSSYPISSFDSNGITLRATSHDSQNASSETYVLWNWLAGGTAPAITYSVKVVSDSGNKYRFDDFGTSAVTLDLQEGGTYTFDQSDSSNSGHPLRFSTTSNGTHGGGSEYTTGVTTTGTPGNSGAKTVITVAASAPTLYYYCTQHSAMGGQANTNSTFGSSNFSGSTQSKVSAGSTQGFSIVSYTGNETAGDTVGHGLGSVPAMFIVKKTSSGSAQNWFCYHASLGAGYEILLNSSNASDTTSQWNSTAPTSSLFTLGNSSFTNASGATYIAYCFAEKKGYSKFGSYTGNGNADGTFVYTGFKPAFLIIKKTSAAGSWYMYDNKRAGGSNVNDDAVLADTNDAEFSSNIDFLSNGVKIRTSGSGENLSGGSFIYMCFAESPFTTSTGIPTTAR
nr:hypothetical protein [uncultured Mediterranean phage uvMED]